MQATLASEHATWLAMYETLSPEERAEYWRQEQRKEQRATIQMLDDLINVSEELIWHAEQFAERASMQYVDGDIDEATVRERLTLAADVIKGNQNTIKDARRDIAHYTKYPIGSAKRRDYIKQLVRRGL